MYAKVGLFAMNASNHSRPGLPSPWASRSFTPSQAARPTRSTEGPIRKNSGAEGTEPGGERRRKPRQSNEVAVASSEGPRPPKTAASKVAPANSADAVGRSAGTAPAISAATATLALAKPYRTHQGDRFVTIGGSWVDDVRKKEEGPPQRPAYYLRRPQLRQATDSRRKVLHHVLRTSSQGRHIGLVGARCHSSGPPRVREIADRGKIPPPRSATSFQTGSGGRGLATLRTGGQTA